MTNPLAKSLLALALLLLPAAAQGQKFVQAYSSISALNATFWIIQDAGLVQELVDQGFFVKLWGAQSLARIVQGATSIEVKPFRSEGNATLP